MSDPSNLNSAPLLPLDEQFHSLNVIAKGNYAIIWMVEEVSTHKLFAIKQFRSEINVLSQGISELMFEKEISARQRLGADVESAAIGIRAVGLYKKQPSIVMDYYRSTLADQLSSHGVFLLSEAIRIMTSVCSCVALLHRANILHRDLKPSNILAIHDYNYRLTDLAASTLYDKFSTLGSFNLGGCEKNVDDMGTPVYMSPEQLRGERELHVKQSDVYSLGVIFYELLMGCHPFEGHTRQEILTLRKARPNVPPVRTSNESIPIEVDEIIAKCLSEDRHERYSDATELHHAIVALAGKLESEKQPKPLAAGSTLALRLAALAATVFLLVLAINLFFSGESGAKHQSNSLGSITAMVPVDSREVNANRIDYDAEANRVPSGVVPQENDGQLSPIVQSQRLLPTLRIENVGLGIQAIRLDQILAREFCDTPSNSGAKVSTAELLDSTSRLAVQQSAIKDARESQNNAIKAWEDAIAEGGDTKWMRHRLSWSRYRLARISDAPQDGMALFMRDIVAELPSSECNLDFAYAFWDRVILSRQTHPTPGDKSNIVRDLQKASYYLRLVVDDEKYWNNETRWNAAVALLELGAFYDDFQLPLPANEDLQFGYAALSKLHGTFENRPDLLHALANSLLVIVIRERQRLDLNHALEHAILCSNVAGWIQASPVYAPSDAMAQLGEQLKTLKTKIELELIAPLPAIKPDE